VDNWVQGALLTGSHSCRARGWVAAASHRDMWVGDIEGCVCGRVCAWVLVGGWVGEFVCMCCQLGLVLCRT
jgi:hypothetical protein